MYAVLVKALWGMCLAWVTFACVKVEIAFYHIFL